MHFIEHIIEPQKLLLAWQSTDEKHRTRYIVAELNRTENNANLTYLTQSEDFRKAQSLGFEAYPAFPDLHKTHENVMDAFMRRLPPRTRGDFSEYLEGLRIKPDAHLSDFALLGYSGAKLLSDEFSIIHPFEQTTTACELFIEAAGYRHIQKEKAAPIQMNDPVTFEKEFNAATQAEALKILAQGKHIGYVNKGLIPTFLNWMHSHRIQEACIEKISGTAEKPIVYLFVKISK